MEYQWVQEFLSSPQLADIVSYVLLIVAYLGLYFVKKFTERDNRSTATKFTSRMSELNAMKEQLENSDKEHTLEREEWCKEREELKRELKLLKSIVKVGINNTGELVTSGISNKLSKLLKVSKEDEILELNLLDDESTEKVNEERTLNEEE